jgi:flagellar hook assembly protein FlgD
MKMSETPSLRAGRNAVVSALLWVILLVLYASPVGSATFMVTNSHDSGAGSLRQAILDANATNGLDSIFFDIPEGVPITIQPLTVLPLITDPVLIDATTQPGFVDAPVIELDGTNAAPGVHQAGLRIEGGGNCTIRGFVINRFQGNGIHLNQPGWNTVEGNFVGTDISGSVDLGNGGAGIGVLYSSNNTIGGITPETRNVLSGNASGVSLSDEATHNHVLGNYMGTNSTGTSAIGNVFDGIWVGHTSSDNTVGGIGSAYRNIISGNNRHGVYIEDTSHGNVVQGNYIGSDAYGIGALGNNNAGVRIDMNAGYNTIGGTTEGARNVISGNAHAGVSIGDGAHHNLVQGNYLGTDGSGTAPLGNSWDGIWIGHVTSSNTIGGSSPGAGNVIADNHRTGMYIKDTSTWNLVRGNCIGVNASGLPLGNDGPGIWIDNDAQYNAIGGFGDGETNTVANNTEDGIRVTGFGEGNAVLSNSVFSNGGLGIDLDNDGVTDNDTGDSDTGPNNLQNHPNLTMVYSASGVTTVQGVLNSIPNTSFTVQLFHSSEADPTGYGEGETHFGDIDVMTDENGNVVFEETFAVSIPLGAPVSATATDEYNNTSEFGPCAVAVPIELVSFTGYSERGYVLLEWSTASECESFGFHIERSRIEHIGYFPITDEIIPATGRTAEPQFYQFEDRNVIHGQNYYYRLVEISAHGEETPYGPISVLVAPVEFSLKQNRPNPFTEATTISLLVPERTHVHLAVYDLTGRVVNTLNDGPVDPGALNIAWTGIDESGKSVANGVYLCATEIGGVWQTRIMTLAK